jgi:YHS domain-containing protein
VDEPRAAAAGKAAEHHGKHYFFCSDSCRTRFLADPDRFAEATDHGHAHGTLEARAEARP